MDQKCIKLHDQGYPNERVIAFCTNLQCKHRLACGLCYYDYHADHITQLVQVKDFYTFAQKQMELQNSRPQAQQIEQLKVLRGEIVQLIDQRCNAFLNDNHAKQPILDDANMQQGITEELVQQLLQPNMFNEGSEKSILNLTSTLQQIQRALKTEYRITRFYYEVENRVYNNCIYTGEVLDNSRHGKGMAKFNNGDTYEGKWKQDKRQGEGVYQWGPGQFEGEVYTGAWKDNKKNGFGRNIYKSGNIYEGMWVNSEKCGQGKMIFAQGEIYEGEWTQNRRNGFGVNRWPNGNQYQGEWKDDKKHGKGVLKLHTGESYEGEFRDDKRNGKGLNKWDNGSMYDGDWVDNKKSGTGLLKLATGEQYKGDFIDDKRNGQGINHFTNGSIYEGQWKEGKKWGHGTLKLATGEQYAGEWVDDKRNGRGVNKFANGNSYDSDWKDDKRNGMCKATFANGDMYQIILISQTGKWVNDIKVDDHEFYKFKVTEILTFKDNVEVKRRKM